MYQALIIVHVLLAVGIISLVMLQQGKGADAGAAFGSGASGTVFGAQGSANFLSRATAVLATLFFATSLALAMVGETRESSSGFMDLPPVESPVSDMPSGQTKANPAPAVSDVPPTPAAQPDSAKAEAGPESGKAANDAPPQAVTPEAKGAPQSPTTPPALTTPEAAAPPVESESAQSTAAAPESPAPPAPVPSESASGAPAAPETQTQ